MKNARRGCPRATTDPLSWVHPRPRTFAWWASIMRGQGKRRNDDVTRLRPGAAQILDRDQEFESRSLRRRVNDPPIADSAVWVSMATCRTTRPFSKTRQGWFWDADLLFEVTRFDH